MNPYRTPSCVFSLVLSGITGKRLTDDAAPSPTPGWPRTPRKPYPQPLLLLFTFSPLRFRCSSATLQRQSNVPWGGGGANQKKVVRGSVDSVAIHPRYELREGIGNAIKVIIKTTFHIEGRR